MCKVIKLNRSTYYKTKNSINSSKKERMERIGKLITVKYNEFKGIYGAPKLRVELFNDGVFLSTKLISRYMKKLGLRSIATKKFRNNSNFKAPDDKVNLLNRNFNTTSINQKMGYRYNLY